jgi:hypothetical protein
LLFRAEKEICCVMPTTNSSSSKLTSTLCWVLGFACLAGGYWVLTVPPREAEKKKLASSTEHFLYLLREGMRAYKADFGAFPEREIYGMLEESFVKSLAGLNDKQKVYLIPTAVRTEFLTPMDSWGQKLVFDPSNKGAYDEIVSAGPDGQFGTADDLSSLNARARKITPPKEATIPPKLRLEEKRQPGSATVPGSEEPAAPPAVPTPTP